MNPNQTERQLSALRVITDQISNAVAASKCHTCGCLHKTVEALGSTSVGSEELAPVLNQARSVFQPKQYECLGCQACYPAIAANAFSEVFPELGSGLDLCPTDEGEERRGWPPLPGEYHVLRYQAPVAVCTLNSESLASQLNEGAPEGLAIVGILHTENLGIERLIRNSLADPHIRFLILCGEDTQHAVGHLPGQSLESLFQNGVDDRNRIRGAQGKRPVLKNLTKEQVQAFREQVELVRMIGEQRAEAIYERIEECRRRDPGSFPEAAGDIQVEVVQAVEPRQLTLDKAGYFVIYPDRSRRRLVLEHYTNAGVLNCVIQGRSAPALYTEAINRNLIRRLDHAAYLGGELARAEYTLDTGKPYVQDRAPGERARAGPSSCECASHCSGSGELP